MTGLFVRRFVVLAILMMSTSLLVPQKAPAPTYRITGLVVNTRDNSPVLRCTITARLIGGGRGGPRDPVLGDTDERGRFSLSLPSAGNWELLASAHNIRSQPLDGHDGYFTGIILTTQAPSYDVVFHAVPDALMTGIVTDEAGEAIRNSQVTLFSLDPEAGRTGGSPMQQRQSVQTDDRGRYVMEALDPGNYMVQAQARPWYATAGGRQLRNQTAVQAPQDPSLDMVYAATWFPGVADVSSASVLAAHTGDELRADFRLVPQPSAHLLIPSSAPLPTQNHRPGTPGGPGVGQNPTISLLQPNGTLQQVFGQVVVLANGDLDVSGLAPGTYQVAAPGQPGRTSMLRIQGGTSTTLNAAPPETSVTVAIDGGTGAEPSQIVLVDSSTGQSFSSFGGGRAPGPGLAQHPDASGPRGGQGVGSRGRPAGGQSGGGGSRGRPRTGADGEEITFQVPPGRYDLNVRGDAGVFVTGINATKGAIAVGRSVTIPEGAVHLTVHLASGFATVSGTVSLAGKPSAGAMVLLVPATLGDPASLTVARRDQTNSDGSFHLEEAIPGQYILLAIDHGWGVHWTDLMILRPYLMHGTPLDLRSSAAVNSKLTAQIP